jgi:hypothetical protein
MADRNYRTGARCTPVDPILLHSKLVSALFPNSGDVRHEPAVIVEGRFPDVSDPQFRDRYLLSEVLRKYPGFDLGIDTTQVAIDSFMEDERLNAATNSRLYSSYAEDPRVHQVLDLAGRKIAAVLGRFNWSWWRRGCRFGPGATTRLKAQEASIAGKLSGNPHCTGKALSLGKTLLSITPQWAYKIGICPTSGEIPVDVRDLDQFEVVPKNAKTGRTIGIQPDLNIYMQLGMGYAMRRKMARWGINLNDQSINQERARTASLKGDLATLDLKSASNSVTLGLVYRLLGNQSHHVCDPTWYRMLEALRTDGALIDETPHTYSLFSSMGNGFTFELESLIFWGLSTATCEILAIPPDVTVYGDDLIVPTDSVELLHGVLTFTGFRLNDQKSFWSRTGHIFRESCGKHYLDGVDVSPFYVDEPLDNDVQIILCANNLLRWATDSMGYRDGRIRAVWMWLVAHLSPKGARTCIPFGDANDGLIKSYDEAAPRCVYQKSSGQYARTLLGFSAQTVTFQHRMVIEEEEARYISWLYSKSYQRFKNAEPTAVVPAVEKPEILKVATSRQKSLRFKGRTVSEWAYLGPWVDVDGCLSPDSVDLELGLILCKAQL